MTTDQTPDPPQPVLDVEAVELTDEQVNRLAVENDDLWLLVGHSGGGGRDGGTGMTHWTDDLTGDEETMWAAYEAELSRRSATEQAQWFIQVYNLGATDVEVRWRPFTGDYLARCTIRRDERKRSRRTNAVGDSIEETLTNLASAVAAYLYPVQAAGATEGA